MKRLAVLLLLACVTPAFAAEKEPTPAQRGYKALTGTAFIPAFWTPNALPNAWKQWGVKEKPADYDAALRERYGLHDAPYPNDRRTSQWLGLKRHDRAAPKRTQPS